MPCACQHATAELGHALSSQAGCLQGHWVKGIIDELVLDELGKVRIVEHKTRRSASVPSEAQKQTARLQVH